MKEWYSISELLAAGLTNFPSSDKGITKKANRENWRKRQRKGVKGKTFEYHVSSMPSFVQETLCGKLIEPKEWFSANELVELRGLPATPQGINKKARTQHREKRSKNGVQGRAIEYHYSSLPEDVQQALSIVGISEIDLLIHYFNTSSLEGKKAIMATAKAMANLND